MCEIVASAQGAMMFCPRDEVVVDVVDAVTVAEVVANDTGTWSGRLWACSLLAVVGELMNYKLV